MAEATGGRLASARLPVSRRAALGALASCALLSLRARGFGQEGAFHPRVLLTGRSSLSGVRATAPSRWAWELVRRTSAPGRLVTGQVTADDPDILAEPFVLWPGDGEIEPLTAPELRGLERFIKLGGVIVVDDASPELGHFGRAARREIARVVPETPLVKLTAGASMATETGHVIFKSYYLLDGPVGRVAGPDAVDAIVRGRNAQVIFLEHDLLGALARTPEGSWALPCEPGGFRQRQLAIRFAVNLAMYVLCSNYKDDQVHARALMRRRGGPAR